MDNFVSIEILGTIAGCSFIITLLTQVFKKYLPEKVDTKWLALVFSILVGVLRIIYLQQFDYAGLVSGIVNIFVLLSTAVGIHEIASSALEPIESKIDKSIDLDINNDKIEK